MEGRTIRIAWTLAILFLILAGNSSAAETIRGYVRSTPVLTCTNRCDLLQLEPDSGFSRVFLTRDVNSTINLAAYLDMHVQVTGYRAGCGGCEDLFVTVVVVLGTNGVADDQFLPAASHLRQNYPNPFNPVTMIEYSLKASARVKLTVFDFLGREISTLVASEQGAGVHRIEWNGSGQSGGIYFYRLTASGPGRSGLIQSKSMMLLR